jgi:hypothetical protein
MKRIVSAAAAMLMGACTPAGESPYTAGNAPGQRSAARPGSSASSATLDPTILPGEIAGSLRYPGGKHPELFVYAIRTDGRLPSAFADHEFGRDVVLVDEPFAITVVPGTYKLVAYTVAGSAGPHVGAMGAIAGCSSDPACQPHFAMTTVTVRDSELVNQVVIKDWNLPSGAVPPEPRLDQYATIPPAAWPTTDLPAFPTPADAAIFGMERSEYRSATGTCPVLNPDLPAACLSFETIQFGTNAAYIRGKLGPAEQLSTIWLYVFKDVAGWHFLSQTVDPPSGQGAPPRVGQPDTIQTYYQGGRCADVHIGPGRQQKTTTCLGNGTQVSIDGGPTYTEETRPDGVHAGSIWWHIVGKGWVLHEFLMPQLDGD